MELFSSCLVARKEKFAPMIQALVASFHSSSSNFSNRVIGLAAAAMQSYYSSVRSVSEDHQGANLVPHAKPLSYAAP
jgi:hypothetical protein